MIRPIRFLLAVLLLPALSLHAGRLVINSNQSNPVPKQAWIDLVEEFKLENPDIEVEFNTYDHESYKTILRNWLTSESPDVIYWFAGERLNTFVSRNLIHEVESVWENDEVNENFAHTRSAISFDGKPYAVPYSYGQWGVYYRTDLFEKYGLSEPQTWEEFLHVCSVLKENDITPIAIGTKFLWPAAGWFDYFNLRINGLDFHQQLMAGKIPYTDQRVRNVFEKWKVLIDAEYFQKFHTSFSWQEALPPFYQGRAGMYLLGNFMITTIPENDIDKYDFFRFPVIDPEVPFYEEAPMDVLAIPAIAKNKVDAKKFLAFVARVDVQEKLNKAVSSLPIHLLAKPKDDRFMREGAQNLSKSKGVSQFYDRDTRPEMAKIGMKGFQEFMDRPERLEKILKNLERARKRIYR